MVFTCICWKAIQYSDLDVNKNYSLCLQEATHTVTVAVMVKLKFALYQAPKAQRGDRGIALLSGFGCQVVSMLASGTQVRGLKPGRSRQIFRGKKILNMPSFLGEVKPSVLCRSFAASKKSLQFPWKS
jgi:hypothetical protein